MSKRTRFRDFITVLVAVWLSAGCNFPGYSTSQNNISGEALKQTLSAQQASDEQPFDLILPQVTGTNFPFQEIPIRIQPTSVCLPPDNEMYLYYLTQPGDTMAAIAKRFKVFPAMVTPAISQDDTAYLPHKLLLQIPREFETPNHWGLLLPDSEVIQSPTSLGFDIAAYISHAGGYLSRHYEDVLNGKLNGTEIIQRVSTESSVNPRFLLALLEYRSGWVSSEPGDLSKKNYPIGFQVPGQTGLYRELVMVATHLNAGYYGWRDGSLTEMKFRDATISRIPPKLNAGSAAVQYLFSKFYRRDAWESALFGPDSFSEKYTQMFGDPWDRSGSFGPLIPEGATQPALELPFSPGERWSLTGGPHPSWKTGSPRGALDFAPVTGEPACAVSRVWALAASSGLVVRSERNTVVIDLDGDGYEQTGWVLLYYHIADKDRIPTGVFVNKDDPIGHPSCEGGNSTGTHFHFARKYNGEWISADGPLRMNLGGWQAYPQRKIIWENYARGTRLRSPAQWDRAPQLSCVNDPIFTRAVFSINNF